MYERPGKGFYATATKAVEHGQLCTELGIVGTAVKQKARAWSDGFAGQQTIAISEKFHMRIKGIAEAATVKVGGADAYDISAAVKGQAIYIVAATNALTVTVGSNLKVGRIVEVAGDNRGVATGRVRIDLDTKDSF